MNSRGAIMVMSVFATIWWMIGVDQSGRGSLTMYAVGIAISGVMVALDWRHRDQSVAHDERRRRGRVIGIASAVEGATIGAAVIVLGNVGRRDLIAPVVAIIVGLHFVPIARWLPAPIYYVTAALLVAVGIAGAEVHDPPARVLTVGMGAAAVLWISCGLVLLRAKR